MKGIRIGKIQKDLKSGFRIMRKIVIYYNELEHTALEWFKKNKQNAKLYKVISLYFRSKLL